MMVRAKESSLINPPLSLSYQLVQIEIDGWMDRQMKQ